MRECLESGALDHERLFRIIASPAPSFRDSSNIDANGLGAPRVDFGRLLNEVGSPAPSSM